jgi:Domain of unknown function (DUF4234)
MKKRNPFLVLILPFLTLGIYSLVWSVKTKNEMNRQGASIPTAWLLVVPLANIYWLWSYSKGVAQITKGALSAPIAFLLPCFIGPAGSAVVQYQFNQVAAV